MEMCQSATMITKPQETLMISLQLQHLLPLTMTEMKQDLDQVTVTLNRIFKIKSMISTHLLTEKALTSLSLLLFLLTIIMVLEYLLQLVKVQATKRQTNNHRRKLKTKVREKLNNHLLQIYNQSVEFGKISLMTIDRTALTGDANVPIKPTSSHQLMSHCLKLLPQYSSILILLFHLQM